MVSYVGLDGFACSLIIYFIASFSLSRCRGGSDEMACKLLTGEVRMHQCRSGGLDWLRYLVERQDFRVESEIKEP